MKHIIIKLSFIFLMMSMLTSSREDAGINKSNALVIDKRACSNGNDYAVNLPCKQKPMVEVKKEETPVVPVADNDVPLSPISRFILLQ